MDAEGSHFAIEVPAPALSSWKGFLRTQYTHAHSEEAFATTCGFLVVFRGIRVECCKMFVHKT